MHFGKKGNGLKEFNTAHGMVLDDRYTPPRLLICDRNHEPKGRLVHYSLEGEFIEEVISGLGMPTSAAIQGDYVSVPDLHGAPCHSEQEQHHHAVLGITRMQRRDATTISLKNNGSKESSVEHTDLTGIKMAISTSKTGTYRAVL